MSLPPFLSKTEEGSPSHFALVKKPSRSLALPVLGNIRTYATAECDMDGKVR